MSEPHISVNSLGDEEYREEGKVLGHPNATFDGKRWRCPDCKAVSFDLTVLEEMACRHKRAAIRARTVEPPSPLKADHASPDEPAFPAIGDLWYDTLEERLWVRAIGDEGDHGWLRVDNPPGPARAWRSGQQSFSSDRWNPKVQDVAAQIQYSDMSGGNEDIKGSIDRTRRRHLLMQIEEFIKNKKLTRIAPFKDETSDGPDPKTWTDVISTRAIFLLNTMRGSK